MNDYEIYKPSPEFLYDLVKLAVEVTIEFSFKEV